MKLSEPQEKFFVVLATLGGFSVIIIATSPENGLLTYILILYGSFLFIGFPVALLWRFLKKIKGG